MWRKDADLNCGRCGDNEDRKKENGCTGPAIRKYERGPGNRPPVVFWRCPVRYIGTDVIALGNTFSSAKETLSVTERLTLPGPFLEAWDLYRDHIELVRSAARKRLAEERMKG